MKIGSCRLVTQSKKSKLGELTTMKNNHLVSWVIWPPKNSLCPAGSRADFLTRRVSENGVIPLYTARSRVWGAFHMGDAIQV